ncbi:hypothetical protein EDD22DRAFT_898046 [Suillus occidentalis]|nr:hypothetical protein EDD22DRAFT_898046 [Suillus occidentalis]
MTRKFGEFQSRVSSLTLDAVKVHNGVQLSDQAAKEARRAKAMAEVGRRIMQLQVNVPQSNNNSAAVPSPCSSPVSVARFQDSDVSKASSPCVQWTIAPSDTKVLHSPPTSPQYMNCKENVGGIQFPSTSVAFCQDDTEVGILKNKLKGLTITAFQPKGAFPLLLDLQIKQQIVPCLNKSQMSTGCRRLHRRHHRSLRFLPPHLVQGSQQYSVVVPLCHESSSLVTQNIAIRASMSLL